VLEDQKQMMGKSGLNSWEFLMSKRTQSWSKQNIYDDESMLEAVSEGACGPLW
jgi:hypothetical protein